MKLKRDCRRCEKMFMPLGKRNLICDDCKRPTGCPKKQSYNLISRRGKMIIKTENINILKNLFRRGVRITKVGDKDDKF